MRNKKSTSSPIKRKHKGKRPQLQPAWLRKEALTGLPAPDRPLAARAPPHLLGKDEVCRLAGVTFPTIWAWMRDGAFPRSRIVGGKSMWLSTEIDAWLAALPLRRLKGDPPPPEAA